MSELFWIGRNLNVHLTELERALLQTMPKELVDELLLNLRTIAQMLMGTF